MNVQTIQDQLRGLRLNTAALELETVLTSHKKAVNLSWVSELLMRETDARKEKALPQFHSTPLSTRFNVQREQIRIRSWGKT